jgi:anti-anti-sigma factor
MRSSADVPEAPNTGGDLVANENGKLAFDVASGGSDDPDAEAPVTQGAGTLEMKPHDDDVVALVGELDAYSAAQLRRYLHAQAAEVAAGQRSGRVVLDLAELRFIDSAGLGVLLGGTRRLSDVGGTLVLRSPPEHTARLFEMSGLNRVLRIEHS